MIIGIFRPHASKTLDTTVTLYAVRKQPPVAEPVNLFCTLVWVLTFEFTTRGLNMTHANIFHYPLLWISETACVELNIWHDLHEHCSEVHIKEAGRLQYALRGGRWQEEEGEGRQGGRIDMRFPFFKQPRVNICCLPPLSSELSQIPERFDKQMFQMMSEQLPPTDLISSR